MTSPLTHLAMIAVLLGGGTYAATPSTSSHRTPPQRDAGTLAALVEWCRVDAGVREDLPDRGCGDLDTEDEQLTVDAPAPPRAVLPGQA
jgi:hypothetical protein